MLIEFSISNPYFKINLLNNPFFTYLFVKALLLYSKFIYILFPLKPILNCLNYNIVKLLNTF